MCSKFFHLFFILIFLNFKLFPVFCNEIEKLTEKFLQNLFEDHRSVKDLVLTDELKFEIDNQINGYLSTLTRAENERDPGKRSKRNIEEGEEEKAEIFLLKGLKKRGSIPINSPKDLCLMKVNGTIYAAGLYEERIKDQKLTSYKVLEIFVRKDRKFHLIHQYKSIYLSKMDCLATKKAGFVGIVNTVTEDTKNDANRLITAASLVFQISSPENIEIIQRFGETQQTGIKMWARDNEFFLVYSRQTVNASTKCTVYKHSGFQFDELDDLPCENSNVIEFFVMYHQIYLFIGNSPGNQTGSVTSYIMKYNWNTRKFQIHQRIVTESVVDAKYFYLDNEPMRQHYLAIASSGEDSTILFYKFVNEIFVPIQIVVTDPVHSLLPVENPKTEFFLLVSYENQDVQIFQHNGWKFEESTLDFTGEAFSKGVSSMRAYDNILNGTVTIVVANQEVSGNLSNIFIPLVTKKNDTSKFQENLESWCNQALKKTQELKVEQVDEHLKGSLSLISEDTEEAIFNGKLFLKNSTLLTVETESLKSQLLNISDQTVRKANGLKERLGKMNEKLGEINNKLNILRLQAGDRKKRQVDPILFQDLVINETINVERINGRTLKDLVYSDNVKNQFGIQEIEADSMVVSKSLVVTEKIDDLKFSRDNLILDGERQVFPGQFEATKIRTDQLITPAINGLEAQEFFSKISSKFAMKIPNNLKQLKCESITIKNFLNNVNFQKRIEHALRINEDQVISGSTEIGKMKVKQVIFQNSPVLSNTNLNNLVIISNPNEKQEIFQDIRFSQDLLTVDQLFVGERINNIKIEKGVAQVLRKRHHQTQVVTAEKVFDEILLFGPINLQGKIRSETLERMNPITTINKNLELEGNYRIEGPITIKKQLMSSENIQSTKETINLKRLMDSGLVLTNSSSTNSRLSFEKPIKIRENLSAAEINSRRTSQFVKTDFDGIQFLVGKKVFTGDLVILDGSCEAKTVNGVDVLKLNQTVLKKVSSETQFINGSVEFDGINVAELKSSNNTKEEIQFGQRFYGDLIFLDQNLILQEVKIRKQNLTIPVKNLNVKEFRNKNGRIFQENLDALIEDSLTFEESRIPDASKSLINPRILNFKEQPIRKKFFSGELTVDQFKFADQNPLKGIINNFQGVLRKDFNYTGDINFAHSMFVKNLHFKNEINGFKMEDFSRVLLTESDQTFTAPQSLQSITTTKVHLLSDTINNKSISEMLTNTFLLNKEEKLDFVESSNEFVVFKNFQVGMVNGVAEFEKQPILNGSQEMQRIRKMRLRSCSLENLKYNFINGFEKSAILSLVDQEANQIPANLNVFGSVVFKVEPTVNFLNNLGLRDLAERAWLSNENTVISGNNIFFQNPTKFDAILMSRVVNDVDLNATVNEYMSLSSDQKAATVLVVNGTAYFKDSLKTEKIVLRGKLKINSSDPGFNISDFNQHVLKKNSSQEITGNWRFQRINLKGNLETFSINNLTFRDDVLKTTELDAEIRGRKTFQHILAGNINSQFLGGVDLNEWFSNSVQLNLGDPQLIQGKVKLHKSTFFNDISVQNFVNNQEFNVNTILTKSLNNQVIQGNLIIKTKLPKAILMSSFDQISLANGINGVNFNGFFQDAFKLNDTEIESGLNFLNPLIVQDLEMNGYNLYDVDMNKFLSELDISTDLRRYEENLASLDEMGRKLVGSFEDQAFVLSHFEFQQNLLGVNIQKAVPLKIDYPDQHVDHLLAVLDEDTNSSVSSISFYVWDPQLYKFVVDPMIKKLDYDMKIFKITNLDKIYHQQKEFLFLEIFLVEKKVFRQCLLDFDRKERKFEGFLKFDSQMSRSFLSLEGFNSKCLGSYAIDHPNILSHCGAEEEIFLETSKIKMISSLNQFLILLNDDRNVEIWNQNVRTQVLLVPNPVCVSSITFNGKQYMAVCSYPLDQSVHHGSIEIYESFNDLTFNLVQTIQQKIPRKIEFSILPTQDLILYALTDNPTQPLIIYKYSGITYFKEFLTYSPLISNAIDITAIQIYDEIELLAVVSKPNQITLIEAVMQKY